MMWTSHCSNQFIFIVIGLNQNEWQFPCNKKKRMEICDWQTFQHITRLQGKYPIQQHKEKKRQCAGKKKIQTYPLTNVSSTFIQTIVHLNIYLWIFLLFLIGLSSPTLNYTIHLNNVITYQVWVLKVKLLLFQSNKTRLLQQ